jgi:hypothetical protein
MYQNLFDHLPIERNMDCFQFVKNNAAVIPPPTSVGKDVGEKEPS